MRSFWKKAVLIATASLSLAGLSATQAQNLESDQLNQQARSIAYQQGSGGGSYVPNARAISLYNLGLTAYKQGSPESAVIFFKRACDIDPNLADAQYNLGVIYQVQKRYKEAIPRFEEVLRIKPTDPDAHFQLGVLFQETGRVNEARQQLLAIAPNNMHFSDAQRRVAQMNNGAVPSTTPTQDNVQNVPQSSPQAVESQAVGQVQVNTSQSATDSTGVSQINTVSASANVAPTQNNSGSVNVSRQPVEQMAYVQPTVAPKTQPANSAETTTAPTPSNNSGPVPVLANASLRVIATGFSAPSGLAFDHNGNLYVANYMTNSIDRIGQDGARKTFCTGISLRGPIGLVIDDSNNLYVANYNGGTVTRISPAGISSVIANGFRKPYYLTLDKEGNLYVSQQEDNSIVRISLPRSVSVKAR